MIGQPLMFGDDATAPLLILALIFVTIFAYFAIDSFGTGDRYDGKVAACLGAGYAGVAVAVAVFS